MKIIADTNIPFVKECFSSIGDVTLTSGRDVTPELVKDADILLVRSITKVNQSLLGGSVGPNRLEPDFFTQLQGPGNLVEKAVDAALTNKTFGADLGPDFSAHALIGFKDPDLRLWIPGKDSLGGRQT